MTKPYGDFEDSDHEDDDDNDDEIGALGSILSWDEDEDGGGGDQTEPANLALSDKGSLHTSTLPDLVSFNLSKDGELNPLQHLNVGHGSPSLSAPMPTQIDYGNTQHITIPNPSPLIPQPPKQPELRTAETNGNKQQFAGNQTVNQQQQQQLQQQLIQEIQQRQAAEQQTKAHSQVPQQQVQLQPQTQQQNQSIRTPSHQAVQSLQQPVGANDGSHQQSQSVIQPQIPQQQQQQQQQQSTMAAAFPFFQANALLAQAQAQNAKQPHLTVSQTIPALMIPNVAQQQPQAGQDQRSDQQQQPVASPQFPFAADPNALQLLLHAQAAQAQLQQQFNSFQQQARPAVPQHVAAAPAAPQIPAALQQQMQFQAQAQAAAAASVAARPPAPLAAAAPTKKGRPPTAKKPPASQTKPPPQSKPSAVTSKPAIVSASDTDGELSKVESVVSKATKKGSASATSTTSARKKIEIDTSNLTPAEKAKANRDRNREHARNTRLRKKAYLEKLKSTVDELCRERDTLVSERAGAASILVDMHNTRTEVLLSFFALRSANEKRRELWSSILDESCFACVLPVTPYRSFPASEVQVSKCQRTILGIDGMMSDTASLHVLLNSLVDRSRFPNATIVFRYTLVTEEAVVAGNQMMARWVMSTLNATQCGARMEVAKQGMLCCKFNSAHKIIGLELMFDVMALMLQLKQAAGAETFSVIPNTVQTCQRSFDKPMVMTLAEEPYTIVQVNKLWEDTSGYKAEDVVGKVSCRILEGEQTDSAAVEVLMKEIRFKRPASAMLVNYKKNGELFRNFFLVYPLSTDSRITHYLYLSSHIDNMSNGSLVDNSAQSQTGLPAEAGNGSGQIRPSTGAQQAFYSCIQNLQGSAAGPANQSSLARPAAPQPLLGLGTVLSNTLGSQASQGAMLPPGMAAPGGNGGVSTQVSLSIAKRTGDGDSGGMPPRKQAKTGEGSDTK